MATEPSPAQLFCDEKIAELTAEIETFKVLRVAFSDPKLADQLAKLFNEHPALAQEVTRPAASGDSTFSRVTAYFKTIANDWRTAPQIVQATAVSRGNLSNLLYKAKRDAFESKENPQLSRMKLWRLRAVAPTQANGA